MFLRGLLWKDSHKPSGIFLGAKSDLCFIGEEFIFFPVHSRIWLDYQEYWHERAAFQGSALGRLTAGNDVVATKTTFFSFFCILQAVRRCRL